jgi:hypothetical protein
MGRKESLRRTFEDIPHLTKGFIFAPGKNLDSCLEIANLKDGDKEGGYQADPIPEGREGITRCCLRKRNSRCAILFWSRRAACELKSVRRCT